jgi:hypothetical protein
MQSISKRLVIALVAVCMLGVLASSASAAFPEFKVKSGDKKFPVTFTGSSSAVLFTGPGIFNCAASSISGEIVGAKEIAKVKMTFTATPTDDCFELCRQSSTEIWETKELKGEVGYLSKAKFEVGLLLGPVSGQFAECKLSKALLGSLIGQLSPTNVPRSSFTLTYKAASGKQAIKSFEGETAVHNLKSLPFEAETGLEDKISLTTSKEVEVVA